jgi:hypothetical protein
MTIDSNETGLDSKDSTVKQAQALLTLFETDCGRAAVTLEEVKEWIWAQGDEHLQIRMQHLLSS